MPVNVIDGIDHVVWQIIITGRAVRFLYHGKNQQIHDQFVVHEFCCAIVPKRNTGREKGTYLFGDIASGRKRKGCNLVRVELFIIVRRIASVKKDDIRRPGSNFFPQ